MLVKNFVSLPHFAQGGQGFDEGWMVISVSYALALGVI